MSNKIQFTEEQIIEIENALIKHRKKQLKFYLENKKNPFKYYFLDFIEGMFKGIGFFFGATVVIAILALILTQYLSTLPIVGETLQNAGIWLENAQNQQNNTNLK